MTAIEYLNFDLTIEPEADGYRASVRNSPAGDASAAFTLPFSAEGLENVVLKLGPTRATVRRAGSSQAALARRFGSNLFEAVFAGDVGFTYRNSVQEAASAGSGLRLRLNLDRAPELADVPWELLYSPTLHRPLVLSTQTPIVRYIGLPFPARPLLVDGPLKILVVVAAPTDLVALDAAGELERIRDATEDLRQAGAVQIDFLGEASLGDLTRRLREDECHVLHFVGHGGYDEHGESCDGVLAFEDANRHHHLVSGDDLGVLLHDHRTLRLAVLNACEGARTSPTDPFAGVAQCLVRQGIPAVIAMQFEVTDKAATLFGHDLYRGLVDGCSVDEAIGLARRAVFADDNDVEWATPVLYLRSTSGRIFDVTLAADPEARLDEDHAEGLVVTDYARREDPDDGADASMRDDEARETGADDRSADADVDGGEGAEAAGEADGDAARRRRMRMTWIAVGMLTLVGVTWWIVSAIAGQSDDSPVATDGTDDVDGELPSEDEEQPADEAEPTDEGTPVDEAEPGDEGTPVEQAPVEEVPSTDFEAAYVEAPSLGSGGTWADGLDRYVTEHPVEGGAADPRVTSQWALGWDEEALYVLVEVEDPELSTPYASEPWLIYRGDGINFNFGADPSGMQDDEGLRDDDRQIIVGPSTGAADQAVSGTQQPEGDGATCQDGRFFGLGTVEPAIVAAATSTSAGYRIEAEVPWSVLHQQPEEGGVYGMNLTVADAGPDGAVGGSRSSHPDRGGAKHCPAQWQTLRLRVP